MPFDRTRFAALLVAGGLAVATCTPSLLAREKRAHFDSRWVDAPIAVDGSPADWPGPLTPFNEQPLSMAAANDGESLFLVLTASDRATRMEILRRGLIVWFDPGGKDKKKFGLHFPIGGGFGEGELGRRRRGGYGGGSQGAGGSGDSASPDRPEPRQQEPSIEPPNRLELLGSSKDDSRSYTADQAPGIAVKVGQAEGLLTYELKVPITANEAHPYAIGARAGATIGVGLEMPKLERPEGRGRSGGGGGGRGPGGMGGGGGMGGRGFGGMGRGGGGGRGPEQDEGVKPLNGWVTVQLAAK